MALEGTEKTLFQLKDKETADDLEHDAQQKEQQGDENYCPMTTRKEIISWWLYDWANSAQMGVGLAFLYPIFLSLMATRYACLNNTPYGCDWNTDPIHSDVTLRVSFGSLSLKPASYAASMLSISSAFQAVAYILFSSLADYGSYKIYLFRITAIITQLMYMSWIFFGDEEVWLFAGLWGALSTIPFGLSLIFYNAYLLELVENHWRIRRLQYNKTDINNKELVPIAAETDEKTERSQNILDDTHENNKNKLIATLQDDISEWGFACGYCGSVIATIIIVVILMVTDDTNTYFTDAIGVNNKKINALDNDHNWRYEYSIDSQSQFYEQNVLPVIEANVWYSTVALYEDEEIIDTFSLINGMRFRYKHKDDDWFYGDMFGNNHTLNNILIDDTNTSKIVIESHSNPQSANVDNIGQSLNVYTNNVNLVSALQFNQDDDGLLFGITNNTKSIQNSHEDFLLGGYEVTLSKMDINFYDKQRNSVVFSMNDVYAISGFNSIGFVATDGPYGSLFSFQISYFLVGVWFFVFSLPAFMYLKNRIRPSIPADSSPFTISVKSYWKVAKEARRYPDLLRYLIVWFLFSDALYTTGNCGILFAQTELGMSETELVALLLVVEFTAVIGAFFFVWLQKKLQWNAKQMLIFHLIIMALLPFYAVFGVIEGSPIGLVDPVEMYVFTTVYGFNQGSLQALSRSLFGHMVPAGEESQFFGLYEITDKGSSWLGPMMVAIVSNYASMRWALIYIFVFYMIAIPLLYFTVDYERGMKRAKEHALERAKSFEHAMNKTSRDAN